MGVGNPLTPKTGVLSCICEASEWDLGYYKDLGIKKKYEEIATMLRGSLRSKCFRNCLFHSGVYHDLSRNDAACRSRAVGL